MRRRSSLGSEPKDARNLSVSTVVFTAFKGHFERKRVSPEAIRLSGYSSAKPDGPLLASSWTMEACMRRGHHGGWTSGAKKLQVLTCGELGLSTNLLQLLLLLLLRRSLLALLLLLLLALGSSGFVQSRIS